MAYNEPIKMLEESSSARVKRLRANCPDAYALSVNEAIRVDRINTLIINFFLAHPEYRQEEMREGGSHPVYHDVYNAESIAQITELLKYKRISLDNTYALAKRVLAAKWFYLMPTIIVDADGKIDFTKRYASLTTNDGYSGIIDRDIYSAFYELWDSDSKYIYAEAESVRQSLSLPAYKMLDHEEYQTLSLIIQIKEFSSEPRPFVVVAQDGFMPISNSPETTALLTIGARALSNAVRDDVNERYDIITATGDSLYLRGRQLTTTSSEWVNIDKLLRQINYKSYQDNHAHKVVIITLDEFMELRGLSDRKEARKQFSKAINDLYNVSLKVSNGTIKGEFRYLQAKAEIENSQASFMLTDLFFDALKAVGSIALLPTSFMRIDGRGSNAYKIAVYLSDHKRRNLNKPNENKVTVGKLLEITSLPDASTISPNRYKQQIIDPFFVALNKASSTGEFTYTLTLKGNNGNAGIEAHYDYDYFSSCVVNVQWLREPDYTKLRESKVREAEAKERGRLKRMEDKARGKKPVKKR